MIIPKANKLDASQLNEVEAIAADFDCSILEIQGRNRCVYAILGDEGREVMFKRIAGLPFISKVDMIESPYKLMDRRSGLSDHRVRVGSSEVGKDEPFIIAGPCTIDPKTRPLLESHCVERAGAMPAWWRLGHQSLFFSGG